MEQARAGDIQLIQRDSNGTHGGACATVGARCQRLGDYFNRKGDSFATPNAKRRDTALLAIGMESGDQRCEDASAGGADGVAKGAGAAVDVNAGVVDVDVLHSDHRDSGESLVDLV